jgi:hypothetical protein
MRLNLSLNVTRKVAVISVAAAVVAAAGAIVLVKLDSKSPVPTSIARQLSYKTIYPAKVSQIDPASYNYQADQKTLSFTVAADNTKVAFTEQAAPDSLGTDGQAYYPALGLHPYAQFKTKLGPVALAKFWQSGSLKPVGESAILASGGTFLIAHSEKSLTNAEWKNLFDSLKISK